MASNNTATFIVRLTVTSPPNPDSSEPNRTQFWKALVPGASVERSELEFRNYFGRALFDQLRRYVFCDPDVDAPSPGTSVNRPDRRTRRLLREVAFRVRDVNYPSPTAAEVKMDVTGVKALIELFSCNFDRFEMFLIGYVTDAFASVGYIGDAGLNMAFPGRLLKQSLDVELRHCEDLTKQFAETIPPLATPAAASSEVKDSVVNSIRTWVPKFSLLALGVIAALLLYWHHAATTAERDRLIGGWEALGTIREKAVAADHDRMVRLIEAQDKTTAALITQDRGCCCATPTTIATGPPKRCEPCPPATGPPTPQR